MARHEKTARDGKYDCVIIGGGHNGLTAAAYLAKANKKVCVLERRHVLGGASTTEELWPGYKVSTAAYVISLFLPEITQDLKLKEYGLKVLPRSPSSFTPTHDGQYLLLGSDASSNHREISKFSSRDAEAFPRYEALLEQVAELLEPVLAQSAPDLLPMPGSWRRIGIRKWFRDLRKAWKLYRALGKLEDRLPEALELLAGPARPILERWFESEVLKATLATDAVIGSFGSISAPGSAYVLLHHVMGEAGGARGVWGYVQGGMGGLSDAIAAAARDLGVEIRRESEVARITTGPRGTTGVLLADGSRIEAKVVASSLDPHQTFVRLLEPDVLPPAFRQAIDRIDYSSASAKINLALSEPPKFSCVGHETAGEIPGVQPYHHGTMH
ncbi:MAG: NAD(P)/FAD-dependent oxidoreductase, partial [Planctomycetales bacterium]